MRSARVDVAFEGEKARPDRKTASNIAHLTDIEFDGLSQLQSAS